MQIDYVEIVDKWITKKRALWKTSGRLCPPLIYDAIYLLLGEVKRQREREAAKPSRPRSQP